MIKIVKNGFSLAEMMVVMLILSIVLAAAAPIITKRTIAATAEAESSSTPAGAIISYASNKIPNGWLLCNGQAISRNGTYADLYNAIGTIFGSGDGSSTFNIPDLRGEFIRGWDNGKGVDSGRIFGSWQADEFKSHNHAIITEAITSDMSGQYYTVYANATTHTGDFPNFTLPAGFQGKTTNNAGNNETRPENITLNYIIKY